MPVQLYFAFIKKAIWKKSLNGRQILLMEILPGLYHPDDLANWGKSDHDLKKKKFEGWETTRASSALRTS